MRIQTNLSTAAKSGAAVNGQSMHPAKAPTSCSWNLPPSRFQTANSALQSHIGCLPTRGLKGYCWCFSTEGRILLELGQNGRFWTGLKNSWGFDPNNCGLFPSWGEVVKTELCCLCRGETEEETPTTTKTQELPSKVPDIFHLVFFKHKIEWIKVKKKKQQKTKTAFKTILNIISISSILLMKGRDGPLPV